MIVDWSAVTRAAGQGSECPMPRRRPSRLDYRSLLEVRRATSDALHARWGGGGNLPPLRAHTAAGLAVPLVFDDADRPGMKILVEREIATAPAIAPECNRHGRILLLRDQFLHAVHVGLDARLVGGVAVLSLATLGGHLLIAALLDRLLRVTHFGRQQILGLGGLGGQRQRERKGARDAYQ
jgi:hypothetical protein